jgi:hypothetical protein
VMVLAMGTRAGSRRVVCQDFMGQKFDQLVRLMNQCTIDRDREGVVQLPTTPPFFRYPLENYLARV